MVYDFLIEYFPKDIVKYIIEEYIYPTKVYCDGCLIYKNPPRFIMLSISPCEIEYNYCDECLYPMCEPGYHKVAYNRYSYYIKEYQRKHLPKQYDYLLTINY